jgi:hypothetical protein
MLNIIGKWKRKVKGKVVPVHFLTKHHAMDAGGLEL